MSNTWEVGRKRLLQLADPLDAGRPGSAHKVFDTRFIHGKTGDGEVLVQWPCGCALGELPTLWPEFTYENIEHGYHNDVSPRTFFALNQQTYRTLFFVGWKLCDIPLLTPMEMAERIRDCVRLQDEKQREVQSCPSP